jgi:hypothetical protein
MQPGDVDVARLAAGLIPSANSKRFSRQPEGGRPSPIKRVPPSRRALQTWHSEDEKAEWLPKVLSAAKRNKAKMFVFWLLIEGDKDGVREGFDTGVLGGPADVLARASFDLDGARPFSKPNSRQNPRDKADLQVHRAGR